MASTKRKPAKKAKRKAPQRQVEEDGLPSTSSGGGPVILLPAEVAASWRGATPSAKKGGESDYDRACAGGRDRVATPHAGIGWLDVGKGRGLVLDAEVFTVWLPTEDGGVVARGSDVSDGDAERLRALVPGKGWKTFASKLELRAGRVFLFDSAAEGAAEPEEIGAEDGVAVGEPGPGTYAVSYVTSRNNDFVRLTRVSGAKVSSAKSKPKARPKTAATAPAHATPKSPRAWKTRLVPRDQAPKRRPLEAETGLNLPVLYADGTVVGRTGPVRASHVIRIDPSGTRTTLTPEPGHYMEMSIAPDGETVLAATFAGKLLELAADPAKGRAPRVVFETNKPIWSVEALPGQQVLIGCEEEIHLLSRKGDVLVVTGSASVKPISLPSLDVLGGGKWVLVGQTPRLFLFAIVRGELRLVETFVQHERGIAVYDGKPYIYASRVHDLEEILDLDEVHASLT